MIYLDSSSLLKLLWHEPESSAVIDALAEERAIVISTLAELETQVQLKAAHLGGEYSLAQLRRLETQLTGLRQQPPLRISHPARHPVSNRIASAPKCRRHALPHFGPLALGGHGRTSTHPFDDPR